MNYPCPCCGKGDIADELKVIISLLEDRLEEPLPVSSGFRCEKHNASLEGSSPNSSHLKGLAIDIPCRDSSFRWRLLKALFDMSFSRIETTKPKHIHIDIDPNKAQQVCF